MGIRPLPLVGHIFFWIFLAAYILASVPILYVLRTSWKYVRHMRFGGDRVDARDVIPNEQRRLYTFIIVCTYISAVLYLTMAVFILSYYVQ